MKIVYTFAEYQAMINSTNAVLPEIIDGFPSITMEDTLASVVNDKRFSIDYEKQEVTFETPERIVLAVSNIVIKHKSAIGGVVKAIISVAKAMKALVGGLKDDVEELVNEEIAEVQKEMDKAA